MRKISILFMLGLISSCSSIPKGTNEMKNEVTEDKRNFKVKKSTLKDQKNRRLSGRIQVVREYAHISDNNILNLEAVYLVPYEEKKISWEDINAVK